MHAPACTRRSCVLPRWHATSTYSLHHNAPHRMHLTGTPAQVVTFCQEKGVGLVVVGPEVPLVAGLADDLQAAGVPTWGPSAKAAQLEGSKAFMKVGRGGKRNEPDTCLATWAPMHQYR